MTTSTGTCLCGSVTFAITLPSLWCAHCHCTLCQRAHGAAYVTWLGSDAKSVEITGETLRWFRSSQEAERGFCNHCGTTLFFRSSRWPGELHIARACITGVVDREPVKNSFYDTHVSWGNAESLGSDE